MRFKQFYNLFLEEDLNDNIVEEAIEFFDPNIYTESFDTPYRFSPNFETETVEDEEEEGYTKEVFTPVQIVKFKTDDGTQFIWYARQDRYSNVSWEIAFGIPNDKSESEKGSYRLDLELTNKGNAFRIFSTILDITNYFIEQDENWEIQHINFSSKGDKRTEFYLKYLVPRIQKFKLESTRKEGDETFIYLERIS